MKQTSNEVVILTACDDVFFPLCKDLITSIKDAIGELPRMRVLDVGMRPAQVAELRGIVEAVVNVDWDLGPHLSFPPWFRAMTARPCLPKYAGDAAVIVWMDSDAWVQDWTPVSVLIKAASNGSISIVEEHFGPGWTIGVGRNDGSVVVHHIGGNAMRSNILSCYTKCFGSNIAATLGNLPSYNTGVFALRSNSPYWAIWKKKLAEGLSKSFHKLVEQQALNILIREGAIPATLHAQQANFVCGNDLPWFDPGDHAFTMPRERSQPLGVIHLTDAKGYPLAPVPVFPDGSPKPIPLVYRLFKAFLNRSTTDHTS